MKNNKLGCLTGTGIIAALITVLFIAGNAFASGSLMFSAGDLNAQAGDLLGGVSSHAQITKCSGCHVAAWELSSMADRCMACHTDIAVQLMDVAKLHSAIKITSPSLSCRACHHEHRGSSARLTDLGDNPFPHDAVGFSLKAHQLTVKKEAFTCADCHQNDITTFASSTCESCHRQIDPVFTPAHVQSYGMDCLDCHDGVDVFGKAFSHAGFAFKLDGGHEGAACEECHNGARTPADFASTSQDCYSCHKNMDVHKGELGTKCGTCHNPSDWKDATYDHNLSAFKLEGEHASVKCEECHSNKLFKGTPTDCYSCHKEDDNHNGKFGADCSVCHTPTSWKDATFDHNLSNFPLTGRHANVACENCHKNNQFKGLSTTCVSCHSDPSFHSGMFGTNCASCHSTNNWSAGYHGSHPGIADEGGSGVNHGSTSCRTCHKVSLRSATCLACHNGKGGGND